MESQSKPSGLLSASSIRQGIAGLIDRFPLWFGILLHMLIAALFLTVLIGFAYQRASDDTIISLYLIGFNRIMWWLSVFLVVLNALLLIGIATHISETYGLRSKAGVVRFILILFFAQIGMLVYWYLYIRRSTTRDFPPSTIKSPRSTRP